MKWRYDVINKLISKLISGTFSAKLASESKRYLALRRYQGRDFDLDHSQRVGNFN